MSPEHYQSKIDEIFNRGWFLPLMPIGTQFKDTSGSRVYEKSGHGVWRSVVNDCVMFISDRKVRTFDSIRLSHIRHHCPLAFHLTHTAVTYIELLCDIDGWIKIPTDDLVNRVTRLHNAGCRHKLISIGVNGYWRIEFGLGTAVNIKIP